MNALRKSLLAVPMLALGYSVTAAEQEPLVGVHVVDAAILRELNLTTPLTVQVPISIAAKVCGIDPATLAAMAREKSVRGCEAKSTDPHFNYFVFRQAAATGVPPG
jgi:hypothetical protein